MSTLEVNSLQHLDASANNLDLDSSGNATVNGNMTATQFYGGGGNLTGVGVDGIVSSADATAITINSSEQVGIGTGSPAARLNISNSSGVTFQAESSNNEVVGRFKTTNASFSDTVIYAQNTAGTGGSLIKCQNSGGTTFEVRGSGGITFNGDTASANALDDYEEGTWTPTCNSGTMSGVTGRYTKIGNRVYIDFDLANFSDKTSASEIVFGGLPYSISTTPHLGTGTIYQVNNHGSGVQIRNENSNSFKLYDNSNPSGWDIIQYNDLGTDPNMALSGSYRTA
jgi:hypothetical protein